MKITCVSASNMPSGTNGTSYRLSRIILDNAQKLRPGAETQLIELRDYALQPCTGCCECIDTHRCSLDDPFNGIYAELQKADALFIVSPHYSPIPPKLSCLLERIEEMIFLAWNRDSRYRSPLAGKPLGIISHAGGVQRTLGTTKHLVNDVIENAADTMRLNTIPYNAQWPTGISIPVEKAENVPGVPHPVQNYNWPEIEQTLKRYTHMVVSAAHQ